MTAGQSSEQVRKHLWKSAEGVWRCTVRPIRDQLESQIGSRIWGQVEIQVWLDHPALIAVQVAAIETVLGAKEDNDDR